MSCLSLRDYVEWMTVDKINSIQSTLTNRKRFSPAAVDSIDKLYSPCKVEKNIQHIHYILFFISDFVFCPKKFDYNLAAISQNPITHSLYN